MLPVNSAKFYYRSTAEDRHEIIYRNNTIVFAVHKNPTICLVHPILSNNATKTVCQALRHSGNKL